VSAQKTQGGTWNWRFILWTAAAGLLSFTASAFLTLVLRERASGAESRPGSTSAARKPVPLAQPSRSTVFPQLPAAGIAQAAPAALVPTIRLNGNVTLNPFAALNAGPPAGSVAAASSPSFAPAKPNKAPVKPELAPPVPSAPAAAPTAPPLPFVAVGAIQGAQVTNGQPVAFIRQQEQLMVVRAGDSIGQNYKVESISAQAIEFTYLPLMQRQTLALAP
jgi:hypothetical protein